MGRISAGIFFLFLFLGGPVLSTCWEGTPVTSLIGFLVFLHWAKSLFRHCPCSLPHHCRPPLKGYSSCGQ